MHKWSRTALALGGVWLVCCLGLAACSGSNAGDPDAPVPDAPDAPPREPIFDAYGSADAFDVATWNIEMFPKSDITVASAQDVIFSLGVDMIAVEEIGSVSSFETVMAGLPDFEYVLSTHRYTPTSYQKVGLITRKDVLTIRDHELILVNQSASMPRPPLRVGLTYDGPDGRFEFDAIIIHLKAGQTPQDRQQRETSISLLDAYIRGRLDANTSSRIVLLGDFNTDPTESNADAIFAPIYAHDEVYQFVTKAAADANQASFLPSHSMLDHVVFAGDFPAGAVGEATQVDSHFADFDAQISDHVPVVAGYAP